jgi:hypothetical protein
MFDSTQPHPTYHSEVCNVGLKKFHSNGQRMAGLTEEELRAVSDEVPDLRDDVSAERDQRKRRRLAHYKPPPAPVVHQKQATPKLTKEEQEQLIGRLHDALLAGIDTGESGPLIALLEKQNSNVHGSLVSGTLGLLAVHCFHLRAKRRELDVRVAALEARVTGVEEAREARTEFKDMGIWDGLTRYTPGMHVTVGSSFWGCRAENLGQRPGSEHTAKFWRLVAKGGAGVTR